MKHVDVVALTQKAVAQAMGDTYMEQIGDLGALDSYKLADVGREVLAAGTREVFSKALISLMAKMEIDERRYTGEIKSIFVDNFDWGGFVERVYFTPDQIIEDDMWSLVNGTVYENSLKFFEPGVKAKIFEEAKGFMIPSSWSEDVLKEAFHGWEEMGRFLSGRRTMIRNTLTLALQSYAHMLISCGIAVSIAKTEKAVHLYTEALAAGIVTEGTTFEEALKSEAFNLFFMKRLAETRGYLADFGTGFNNGDIPTFTLEDDNKLILLKAVETSFKFNGKRQTYNLDQIGFGPYETVAKWQGFAASGESNYNLDTVSTVMIAADSSNKLGIGTSAFTQAGIAAVCFDHRAMGLCPYKEKTTSNYVGSADFWNEYLHILVNYILDDNFPIVAFVYD